MPPLDTTLAEAQVDDVLELDELWSFVLKKSNQRWVWVALCRRTRQNVACKGLVQTIAPFDPEIILAIGRGGYYPGTLIAHMLQAELYPVRLSRRVHDVITYDRPVWLVRPPELVQERRVLIVDEISSTGETLVMVKQETEHLGAVAVRSAVLYAHARGSSIPDYIGLVSDDLLLNPWDREIFRDGVFQFHPEYLAALNELGLSFAPSLLIDASTVKPAKYTSIEQN